MLLQEGSIAGIRLFVNSEGIITLVKPLCREISMITNSRRISIEKLYLLLKIDFAVIFRQTGETEWTFQ